MQIVEQLSPYVIEKLCFALRGLTGSGYSELINVQKTMAKTLKIIAKSGKQKKIIIDQGAEYLLSLPV